MKEKKVYKSFTCDDPTPKGKRKCEAEAAAWAQDKESNSRIESITCGKALDNYIIKVEFPKECNGIEYSELVDYIDVKIKSWQKTS